MNPPLKLSVLDLCPVPAGSTSSQALQNTLDLARFTEQLGYHRYWLAEHHNFPGLASSAPEIMIGQVAGATKRLRVGAGGIMLPNHTPLKVAETFRLLEALYPGRIDLGLGRAPGTDSLTAQALRRSPEAVYKDDFPERLGDLLCFFGGAFPDGHPYRPITAVPADVKTPELWLLSSSGATASLAGQLGLGYAFAHHIHAEPVFESMRLYRESLPDGASGRSLIGVLALCAPTDERAEELAAVMDLARLRLAQGKRALYPTPQEARDYPYSPPELEIVRQNRRRMFVGSVDKVKAQLTDLAEKAGTRELMILTVTHDHQDRRESYRLLAEAFGLKPA
ncbi:MAG TPA: LLM class flavin-dependent oxidoreductase [bacterium]|nr:LLM class flavin-dependent oxidoreductase [bacterium]